MPLPRLGLILLSTLLAASAAPTPTPRYVPRQSDRPSALDADEPGFRPIFDGATLAGWKGNPTYWRVESGAIVGEITPETRVRSNTFLVWQGGAPRDFELRLEYRITPSGNSGINYRSAIVPDPVTPENAFAMRGYQCDVDGRHEYTGNNYEEKGRLFLALRGQLTRVVGGRPPILVAEIARNEDLRPALADGWNSVHIIARGRTLLHLINGRLMSAVIDDDDAHRPLDGQIGMQVHVGPPMRVEYRNLRLKVF